MNINNFIMGIRTTSIGYIYFTHFFTMNCLCVTESSAYYYTDGRKLLNAHSIALYS